ncbi:T9SS type A sorting domain-containing protein [uncultured Algibacter sp.]|uniref:T9SS type A sorting domain-containing protein n=1 Tax=uncultured Algibacter sp. TaxID=298659 RepID=UPI00260BD4C6|nr:T9SS type A sorting domain-containing protein [uncultured Algibacter sp.]
MKKTTLNLLLLLLFTVTTQAQTTYTYSYSEFGDWTETANWSPSYPGTTINSGDIVNVDGDVELNNSDNIINYGTLNVNGIIFGSGTISNYDTLNVNGYLNSSGTISNHGTCNVNNGDITVPSFINLSVGTISVTGISTLRYGITNDGTINNYGTVSTGGLTLNGSGTFTNIGVIELINTNIDANQTFINTSSGTCNTRGLSQNYSYSFTNDGTLTVLVGTFESVHCTNNGTITVNNTTTYKNTSELFNTGTFNNNGTLTGVNTHHTGNFSNAGILSPGNSPTPGPYVFINDYTHESSATLITELESTSNYDTVFSYEAITLGGTLDVSLLNGFTPAAGDSFTIITASSITGTFDTANLPSGYNWNINYTPTNVILEIVTTLSNPDFNLVNVALYPNPAKNQFTIQLNNTSTLVKVNIYNMLGQAVLTTKETNINTSKLTSGSYFVEVITSKGKVTKKLILE